MCNRFKSFFGLFPKKNIRIIVKNKERHAWLCNLTRKWTLFYWKFGEKTNTHNKRKKMVRPSFERLSGTPDPLFTCLFLKYNFRSKSTSIQGLKAQNRYYLYCGFLFFYYDLLFIFFSKEELKKNCNKWIKYRPRLFFSCVMACFHIHKLPEETTDTVCPKCMVRPHFHAFDSDLNLSRHASGSSSNIGWETELRSAKIISSPSVPQLKSWRSKCVFTSSGKLLHWGNSDSHNDDEQSTADVISIISLNLDDWSRSPRADVAFARHGWVGNVSKLSMGTFACWFWK